MTQELDLWQSAYPGSLLSISAACHIESMDHFSDALSTNAEKVFD